MNKLKASMELEAAHLEQSIKDKEQQISTLPEGELKCYSSGNRKKRYVVLIKKVKDKSNDEKMRTVRQRTYIKSSESDSAEQLAVKGLLNAETRDEKRELNAINRYLKFCSSFDSSQKYLDSNSDINHLVEGFMTKRYKESTQAVNDWLSQRCGVSAGHEDGLRVKTHAGFNVRSKSERDILHALMDFGIPYKFEEQVITDIGPLYPDFTILNPLNNQEVIWEHNGSMDDPEYAAKVFKRTAAYYRKGYHPGKNFIITYEENNEGLDKDWIEAIIRQYFTDPYRDNVGYVRNT